MKPYLTFLFVFIISICHAQIKVDASKPNSIIELPKNIIMSSDNQQFKLTIQQNCIKNDTILLTLQVTQIGNTTDIGQSSTIKFPIPPKNDPRRNEQIGFLLIPAQTPGGIVIPKMLLYGLGLASGIIPPDKPHAPRPSPSPKKRTVDILLDPKSPYVFNNGILGLIEYNDDTDVPPNIGIYATGRVRIPRTTSPTPTPTPTQRNQIFVPIKNSSSLSLPICNKKYDININIDPKKPIIDIISFVTLE